MVPSLTFDANILFYSADRRDVRKYERAGFLLSAASTQGVAFLTLQAIGEFAHASVRKGTLTRREAAQSARDFASVFDVRAAGPLALETALDWWADERYSYWDALFLATAAKAGAVACVSEDFHDGAVTGGVEIINPFAANAAERLAVYGLKL